MPQFDPRVDAYIEKSADFAKPILLHLRELVHAACPEVEETWKWSFPVFVYKGAIMCNMAAFKEHAVFGFWKAALLSDVDNILTVTDRQSMGHLGKLQSVKDLPKNTVLKKYIKAAMKLNEDGIKVPAKPKPAAGEKKEVIVPAYFISELKKNKDAAKVFKAFSYSNKREYIEWFEDAKTEETRNKRMAQALEWIAEGKSRHWKYKNC